MSLNTTKQEDFMTSVCKNDGEPYTSSLFYNREDAREACNILNKMRADGQLGRLFK